MHHLVPAGQGPDTGPFEKVPWFSSLLPDGQVSPQEGVLAVHELHVLLLVDDVGVEQRQLLQHRLQGSPCRQLHTWG